MGQPQIKMDDVNLSYSSLAYRSRSIGRLLNSMIGKPTPDELDDVHALKNVDLHIKAGERVGLIGPNGSGKSTLLKAMAGLYPIQSGHLTVDGTVRQILDLMLGFEPEATGRQNILYRGLLLGENPASIAESRDEIIRFADIGKFIDYPVKIYSAGMAVRLAYSISTAFTGDVLLIDEVIGAGDQQFMSKAKARFQKMVDGSNILVIASHDHHSLSEFCSRGLVLRKGEIKFDGTFDEARKFYEKMDFDTDNTSKKEFTQQ